jgi:hypothetical protein
MFKTRRSPIPYNRQPPSAVAPVTSGLGRGLVVASSITYDGARTSSGGVLVPTQPNVAPTFSAMPGLGKTTLFVATGSPLEYNLGVVPPPFSAMVRFRITTNTTQGTLLAFGGAGDTGLGWGLSVNTTTAALHFDGVASYSYNLNIAADVDYTIVITVSGNLGTTTCYLHRADTNSLITSAPVAVGTMRDTTKKLTIGCAQIDTGFADEFAGHIGSFGIWDRELNLREVHLLLGNPYQLWPIPDAGARNFSLSVSVSVPVTGLEAASALGNTFESATGVGAASALGNIFGPTVGVSAASVLGNTFESANGLASASALGVTTQSAAANVPATGVFSASALGNIFNQLRGVVGPTGVTAVATHTVYHVALTLEGIETIALVGAATLNGAGVTTLAPVLAPTGVVGTPVITTSIFAPAAGTIGWEPLPPELG